MLVCGGGGTHLRNGIGPITCVVYIQITYKAVRVLIISSFSLNKTYVYFTHIFLNLPCFISRGNKLLEWQVPLLMNNRKIIILLHLYSVVLIVVKIDCCQTNGK